MLLLAVPLMAQHGRYESESNHPSIGDPKAIAAGEMLYLRSCAGCHAPDGSGGRGPNLVRRPMWHPLSDEKLFSLIRNGLPGASMPPTNLSDDETWNLVAFIHALIGPAAENPAPGDAAAGEKVFWSEKTGCSNCHAIHGKGGRLGPDLTSVGWRRSAGHLRASILDPDDDIDAGYRQVTVRVCGGGGGQGILLNEDAFSIQVLDRAERLRSSCRQRSRWILPNLSS